MVCALWPLGRSHFGFIYDVTEVLMAFRLRGSLQLVDGLQRWKSPSFVLNVWSPYQTQTACRTEPEPSGSYDSRMNEGRGDEEAEEDDATGLEVNGCETDWSLVHGEHGSGF